ncbi:hypothetical protein ACFX13_025225 [Malus domestica]
MGSISYKYYISSVWTEDLYKLYGAFKYLISQPCKLHIPLQFSSSQPSSVFVFFSLTPPQTMVSKFKRPCNLIEPAAHKLGINDKTSHGSSVAVGLGILVQNSQRNKTNIIEKSALRLSQSTTCSSLEQFSCFLKTCHLCNKGLSLDREVYMYRGDLGFCSIECRNRQIVIDDMKELEASTKQMITSYRRGLYRCSLTKSSNANTSRRGSRNTNVFEDVHLQQEKTRHQRKIFVL